MLHTGHVSLTTCECDLSSWTGHFLSLCVCLLCIFGLLPGLHGALEEFTRLCFSVCVGVGIADACFLSDPLFQSPLQCAAAACSQTCASGWRTHCGRHCKNAELSLGQRWQGVCVCVFVSTYQCASCYVWHTGTVFHLSFYSMKHFERLGFQVFCVPKTSYNTFVSFPVFPAFTALSLALIFTRQPCAVLFVCVCVCCLKGSIIHPSIAWQKMSGCVHSSYWILCIRCALWQTSFAV